jgi:hypothetical protein
VLWLNEGFPPLVVRFRRVAIGAWQKLVAPRAAPAPATAAHGKEDQTEEPRLSGRRPYEVERQAPVTEKRQQESASRVPPEVRVRVVLIGSVGSSGTAGGCSGFSEPL